SVIQEAKSEPAFQGQAMLRGMQRRNQKTEVVGENVPQMRIELESSACHRKERQTRTCLLDRRSLAGQFVPPSVMAALAAWFNDHGEDQGTTSHMEQRMKDPGAPSHNRPRWLEEILLLGPDISATNCPDIAACPLLYRSLDARGCYQCDWPEESSQSSAPPPKSQTTRHVATESVWTSPDHEHLADFHTQPEFGLDSLRVTSAVAVSSSSFGSQVGSDSLTSFDNLEDDSSNIGHSLDPEQRWRLEDDQRFLFSNLERDADKDSLIQGHSRDEVFGISSSETWSDNKSKERVAFKEILSANRVGNTLIHNKRPPFQRGKDGLFNDYPMSRSFSEKYPLSQVRMAYDAKFGLGDVASAGGYTNFGSNGANAGNSYNSLDYRNYDYNNDYNGVDYNNNNFGKFGSDSGFGTSGGGGGRDYYGQNTFQNDDKSQDNGGEKSIENDHTHKDDDGVGGDNGGDNNDNNDKDDRDSNDDFVDPDSYANNEGSDKDKDHASSSSNNNNNNISTASIAVAPYDVRGGGSNGSVAVATATLTPGSSDNDSSTIVVNSADGGGGGPPVAGLPTWRLQHIHQNQQQQPQLQTL
ncbi:probable serine/threonine-protein kinase clkA, partial [Aplysia californica]|uniref:Probable serine/threonine-protein kinase clkA n=1 Tax=Aplysia californica TaxID=6500 RepID=A0ABM1AFF9_APLCA